MTTHVLCLPCSLHCPRKKLVELRRFEHRPLLYHFQSGPGPAGLFCALVVYLISRKCWNVCHNKPPLQGSFSNALTLRGHGMPVTVTIVDSGHQFELYCQDYVKFPEEHFLPRIRATVENAIQTVVWERKYRIAHPVPAFFCRECGGSTFDHAATIVRSSTLVCVKTEEEMPLNEQEKEWLSLELSRRKQCAIMLKCISLACCHTCAVYQTCT